MAKVGDTVCWNVGDVVYLAGGYHPMTVLEFQGSDRATRCAREDPGRPLDIVECLYPAEALISAEDWATMQVSVSARRQRDAGRAQTRECSERSGPPLPPCYPTDGAEKFKDEPRMW